MAAFSQIWSTPGGRPFLVLWLSALSLVVVISVIGALKGETFGWFAFAILPGAILLDLSIVAANRVGGTSVPITKVSWVSLCIAELAIVLIGFDGRPNSDIDTVLLISMSVLSFPGGLVAVILVAVISSVMPAITGTPLAVGFVSLFLTWVGFFAIGYVQWFWLLPRRTAAASNASI